MLYSEMYNVFDRFLLWSAVIFEDLAKFKSAFSCVCVGSKFNPPQDRTIFGLNMNSGK